MTIEEIVPARNEFDREKVEAFIDEEEPLERKLEHKIILKKQLEAAH